jgi:hypothetical protein
MYEHENHDDGCWDDLASHRALIRRLTNEYPDGWALSLGANNLRELLPLCPDDVRVAAWVKGWCSWKPNTYPAYAWEPVIFTGGRKPHGDKTWLTARDWMQCNVTTGEPVKGAKPQQFCNWIFAMLGAQRDDEMIDLFPGSGAVERAWTRWCGQFDFALAASGPVEEKP